MQDNEYYFRSDFSLFNLFKKNNDPYVLTPGLGVNWFNFKKGEQYISITGNESDILKTTPQLYAVVYRRATMLANGRFIHYDKDGEPIEKSPVVEFLKKPNPFQKQNEWIIQQDVQKSTYGNCFIYFLKGSALADMPSALWNITPKGMIVKRTGKIYKQTEVDEIITEYLLNIDKNTGQPEERFEPSEILHRNIQDVDDPIVGPSPLHALKMPISNIRGAYGFRNVLITEKGAIGMISNDSKNTSGALPLTEKERKSLEDQFQKNYGINDRQRRIIMSSASLKWNPMSYPTRDMMLFEEIDEDTRMIIDAYGMNEALFSLGNGTTFDNYNTGLKAAYQDTIIPEGEDLANGLSDKFGLTAKGEKLVLDFSHIPILQEDQETEANIIKTRAEATNILIQSGQFTPDQINEIMGIE